MDPMGKETPVGVYTDFVGFWNPNGLASVFGCSMFPLAVAGGATRYG